MMRSLPCGAVHFLPLEDCLHILNCEELNHVVELGEIGADEHLNLLQGVLAQELLAKPVALVPVH